MALDAQELFALALQDHRAGRLEEAERLYRKVLHAAPNHADALHLNGVLLMQTGRDALAVRLIRRAIQENANEAVFHNNLGNALQRLGEFAEAVEAYQAALRLDPQNPETFYNLASALQATGRFEDAVAAFGRALALRPGYVEAYNQLAILHQRQGRLDDAVASYRAALALRAFGPAQYGLGTALQAQNKLEKAADAYRAALELMPDCAEAYSNLGSIFALQGRPEEARASFDRALSINPDYATARLARAVATVPVFADTVAESMAATGDFLAAVAELKTWRKAHPKALGPVIGTSQPYHLLYRPQDITLPLKRYGEEISAAAAEYWNPTVAPPPPRPRLRIGIVCGYVQERHPVWNIVLRGILAELDRMRFETVIYHTGSIIDGETAWAERQVDRFVQGPKTTAEWLSEIAADQPDILFYPEIGMEAVTCALAALRLAPLQVLGQGNAMTSGFPTMDIYFSGKTMEGPEADRHYTEKLVCLPGSGLCLNWQGGDAIPWDGPARPDGTVRFALWLQPIKFDPANDGLYARIAKAAAPCEFWLVRPQYQPWTADRLRDRMAAAFDAEGLDPETYLRIGSWLTRERLSGLFDAMDVYLDSPAFSGCTTAWQALTRGMPIVTLEGEFLRQRQTAGLLRQIGIIDTIASDREVYVSIAKKLACEAREPAKYAARRAAIRAASVKLDGNPAAVRAFEQTLIDALRR
jgi:protein O-GlcNAc transferase